MPSVAEHATHRRERLVADMVLANFIDLLTRAKMSSIAERACNQRDAVGLSRIESMLEPPAAEPNPSAALLPIVVAARQSDWESACRRCRELSEDQVGGR